jgi:NAD(P)-dependent dehydrogenase (short-subunit alcohol dehydrogenase family)
VSVSVRTLIDLTGRVAAVTGGAGHVGTAIVEAYAELGATIVVIDLDQAACDAAAGSIRRRFGVDAIGHAANLADDRALQGVAPFIEREARRLDVLVNAAAMVGTARLAGWAVPFESQSVETWRKAIDVNLTAPFALVQSCSALLRRSGHGSVINIASIYGVVGPDWRLYEATDLGNPAAYSASKGGLLQLTRWLATTLAPAVRVNAITPGGVFRDTKEPFLSKYVSRVPLGRMATEDDLKGAAVYLASDLSSYVTGHNLVVDGGWTAW